ncbi:hypothetical protein GGD83_004259 [Rhodoblastus sphagnicola]|uniref:hypothetical protein n=1 Tax=Rhodoblastus sphagnicola TaxID=333368 RepID=UPI0011B0B149|nr:hypothetical protein [Rhodoblastus sphagnicola]MBB4200430.1 hypothetical protein [Rhodoblastus sphagnicola]
MKLDVEGVEEAALRGASQLLERDTLLVYEEQGSDKLHANTRFVSHELGMKIFIYTNHGFIEAHDPVQEVATKKEPAPRL